MTWPDNKTFAFTIFDDTDYTTLENGPLIYDFLYQEGLRTTKSVWVFDGERRSGNDVIFGDSCENPEYLEWVLKLQKQGFEIAYHSTRCSRSPREIVVKGLESFRELFGRDPRTLAQHADHTLVHLPNEAIYWGENRLSGMWKKCYKTMMYLQGKHREIYQGEIPTSPYFWGDVCQAKIKYVRNFVFEDINTLHACPGMPYHDPSRPFVNFWFGSSEAGDLKRLCKCLSPKNVDKLESEGGACILYTHLGSDFVQKGVLDAGFQRAISGVASRNGWFVPVEHLLDYLLQHKRNHDIGDKERSAMERRWLLQKIKVGTQ